MDRASLVDYIRRAAEMRGIDPDVAVKVAESEGLNATPEEGWQSQVVRNGKREESYGPFQLYMGGGLGNVFQEKTGFDPRDPTTVAAQVDFALDEALKTGWGPWYGARRVGLSNRSGLPDPTGKVSSTGTTASEDLMNNSLAPDVSLRPKMRPDDLQASNKSSLDDTMDALAYLDMANLGGAPAKPRDLGARIHRGRQGAGAQALKRLGLASLV